MKDERFRRFIKHRSIVDLQQTVKYARFTKIQHTLMYSTTGKPGYFGAPYTTQRKHQGIIAE